MKPKLAYPLLLILLALLISACAAKSTPTEPVSEPPVEPTATSTPDPCTGWTCTLEGVVYQDTASLGNGLAGVTVDFTQVSNCSPTRGESQAITEENGHISFEVFLHDTDSFVFEVNLEGYQQAQYKMGGFDCLYCACDPVEIVLQPAE